MQELPCLLCGRKLEKRTSKRQKPYFTCLDCGTQFFVRGKQGIEKLEEIFALVETTDVEFAIQSKHFCKTQAVLREIENLRGEIDKIGISHVFSLEQSRIRDALLRHKENLLLLLEAIVQRIETEPK